MCLFCKIAQRTIPAAVVFESEQVLAFRDIHPMAPTHALVIPKRHIEKIHDMTAEDGPLLAELFLASRSVAEQLGLGPKGYRLVVNNGDDGGQSVHHLHVHVLGGRPMGWPPG